MNLDSYRKRLDRKLQEYRHASQSVKSEKENLKKLKVHHTHALEAQKILQAVAQTVQTSAHDKISRVVTRCLKAVGWDYEFKIHFDRKRGKTEARMVFLRQGHEVKPIEASGGGPVDIAAFALRVACLILATPKKRRLLCLDEPYRNINGQMYRERAAKLLETLSRELQIQVILATGEKWLRIGKVIDVEQLKCPENMTTT